MGGRAGSAGSAGSTGCPTAAPEKDASCSAAASCYYPGERCDCAGMMDDLKWHCRGSGEACPANAPTSGGACESEMGMPLACPYSDGSECHCEHDEWKCDMPPDPSAGGAPPEPPGPPDPAAGGAPDMPGGGRPGGPDPMDPGGRAG